VLSTPLDSINALSFQRSRSTGGKPFAERGMNHSYRCYRLAEGGARQRAGSALYLR
jgi:hypothetical protein